MSLFEALAGKNAQSGQHVSVVVRQLDGLDEFRASARRLLAAKVLPANVMWSQNDNATLFNDVPPEGEVSLTVPRAFMDLARFVACHREEQRWALLYEALWRIAHGEKELMERAADPLVFRLRRMVSSVSRDKHRMTAFVRFRAEKDHYIAWYEPQHRVLRLNAPFFIDRFASMGFSILTPDLTFHWDGKAEHFAPGLRREDAVSEDTVELWWTQYYAAIFNPARTNARLMKSHMPARYWRDLPEAAIIRSLIAEAGVRTDRMIQRPADVV